MITIGLGYMAMGSPLFLNNLLGLRINHTMLKTYSVLFIVGLFNLIGGLLKIIFPSDYWYIILVITMTYLLYYSIKMAKELSRRN